MPFFDPPPPYVTKDTAEIESQEEAIDDSVTVNIQSQEHCTWLLNVIRLHAKEISSEQLEDFKNNQVSHLVHQIEALKKDLQAVKSTVDEVELLKLDNAKKQKRIERLEYENSKRQSEIHSLRMKLDETQQKDLENCLQIVGLPEVDNEKEDVKELTKLTKNKLGVKLKVADIVHMHRLGKKKTDRARNVVIKLKDKETRDNIYNQRKKLIKPGNPSCSVYFNDSLTLHRQQLLFGARKLVKARKMYAAWSQQGNVLVKKKESSKIIQINDHCDLMKVKMGETDEDEGKKSSGLPSRTTSGTTSDVTHLSDYEYYYDSD